MTTVLCDRTASGDWQLYCEGCLVSLDIISGEVLLQIREHFAPVMCLECEGVADEIPDILFSDDLPYTLVFDGHTVFVDPWEELKSYSKRLAFFRDEIKRIFDGLRKVSP